MRNDAPGLDESGRLPAALAVISDHERPADVGEWLVRCKTGAELLSRIAASGAETGGGGR